MSEFIDFTERNAHVFEDARYFAEQISDQNRRFEEIQDVFSDEPEIRALAEDGVADEQLETFVNIVEANGEQSRAFTSLGEFDASSYNSLRDARALLEENEEEVSQNEERLENEREQHKQQHAQNTQDILTHIEKLSPKALDKVKSLLEGRAKVGNNETVEQVEGKLFELMEKAEELSELIEGLDEQNRAVAEFSSKQPAEWELPKVLLAKEVSIGRLIIDELPVQPKLNSAEYDMLSHIKEHNIDQPEATLYAALYLSSNKGRVVTVDELVNFLYEDTVIATNTDHKLRSRITTVLGPMAGDGARKILEESGCVLQYGWRRTLETIDGHTKIASRRRIYRAIDLEQIADIDLTQGQNTDEFEEYFTVTEALLTTQEHAQFTKKETKRQQTTEDLGSLALNTTTEASVIQGPDEPATAPEKTLQSQPRVSTEEAASIDPLEQKNWQKAFRNEVGAAITRLEQSGLLRLGEEFTLKQAHVKGPGGVFGTRTAVKRISNAGLTSRFRGLRDSAMQGTVLCPNEMVFMQLFNTNRDILGQKGRNQREAIKIVEEALESYFAHKEQE